MNLILVANSNKFHTNFLLNLTGNHWGKCTNGTEATGCGPQETWINCSDIGVNHNNGIRGPAEVGNDDEKRWLVHRSLQ